MRTDVVGRLVALRKRAKKTATEVSLELGHSRHYVSRVENGLTFPRTMEALQDILKIYGSNLEELFYWDFKEYHSERELLEKFRCLCRKSKDVIISFIHLMYENGSSEMQETKEEA